MKSNKISKNEGLIKTHRSYSPAEIMAAGGTTAFGRKLGRSNEALIAKLQELPPIDDFTDEEWADLLKQLENDK